jgi:GTPase SAR1 family protein
MVRRSGWGGVISNSFKRFELRCINSYRYVFPEYIADLVKELRKYELPATILVCGDNGSGKSTGAAILFKCISPDAPFDASHVVFAEDKSSDFLTKLDALNNDVLVVDELTKFMNYRSFMNQPQNILMQQYEIARAKNVATISCVNSYFKVDKAFREGKVQIVVQLFDRKRVDDGLGLSCGAVFAAPPLMLSSARFGLDSLAEVHSDQEFINLAPWLKSFRGFIFFPNKKEYISDEKWKNYTDAKMRGIRKSFEQGLTKITNQEERELKGLEESEMSEEEQEEKELVEAEKKIKLKKKLQERLNASNPSKEELEKKLEEIRKRRIKQTEPSKREVPRHVGFGGEVED